MFNLSKAIIIGATAILSNTAAYADDTLSATFRFDRALSVEQNYAAFELTAKRACDAMSALEGIRTHRTCRSDLLTQAVSATGQGSFIAHHEARTGADRQVASLVR